MWFNLKEFIEDVKQSRFAQIWALFWAVNFIVLIIATVHFANRAAKSAEGDAYKLVIERHTHMRWPEFRLELTNHSEVIFGDISCATSGSEGKPGKPITLVKCLDGNSKPNTCFQSVDADDYQASATEDLIQCIVLQIPTKTTPNLTNEVVMFSLVENRANSSWNRAYVQPNDQIDIFLRKEEFTPLVNPGFTRWELRWAYVDSRREDNFMEINIRIDSFHNHHWYGYESGQTGFMAFGQIFGFGFGLYVLHSFVMMIVGLFVTNNAKSLGGAVATYTNL